MKTIYYAEVVVWKPPIGTCKFVRLVGKHYIVYHSFFEEDIQIFIQKVTVPLVK